MVAAERVVVPVKVVDGVGEVKMMVGDMLLMVTVEEAAVWLPAAS